MQSQNQDNDNGRSAPFVRRATRERQKPPGDVGISIHALREEGDSFLPGGLLHPPGFLSTPSARRATPRGVPDSLRQQISIHALREEGDRCPARAPTGRTDFYPRPPRGGRHCGAAVIAFVANDFYPRPPRGGRHTLNTSIRVCKKFLSTPSARRATLAAFRSPAQTSYFYPRPPRGGRLPAREREVSCW